MWPLAIFYFTLQIFVVNFANCAVIKSLPKTSCLDYLKDGIEANGHYPIAGQNGETMTVFCDFTSEPGSAWTLVMSWSLANKNLPAFRSEPLTENVPVNEKSPNWVAYRMSKQEMAYLKSQSSHWRATCSFSQFKFNYRDYLRGNFKDFDITTYLGAYQCKKIEFINIRGHVGYQRTIPFWQIKGSSTLHTDSSHGKCQIGGGAGAVPSEDNFGHYGNINPKFRCSSGPTATTQYWFGGYL